MLDFDYFLEKDSDTYTFYRIPKVLFTDERFEALSTDAKLLYGILLDRVGLSRKNGWVDEFGHVYIIFTINEMTTYLKWTRYHVFHLLDELDKPKGIGLIERRKLGNNRPNVIYVKNFASIIHNRGSPEKRLSDYDEPKKGSLIDEPPEVRETNFRKSGRQTSGSLTDKPPEVCQSDSNDNNKSKTEKRDIDLNNCLPELPLDGSFHNVIFTEKELTELQKRFPYDWYDWIEKLSAFMASTGKTYRNHFATICSWAAKEQKPITGKCYDIPEGKGL